MTYAYRVPKKTAIETLKIASYWRKVVTTDPSQGVAASSFIEVLDGVSIRELDTGIFDVRSKDELSSMGRYDPVRHIINIRDDIYDGACEQCEESLFTIAHEFGHFCQHRDLGFNRLEPLSVEEAEDVPLEEHSEAQADLLACALCLDPHHFSKLLNAGNTFEKISKVFLVPANKLQIYAQRLVDECGYDISTRDVHIQMRLDM